MSYESPIEIVQKMHDNFETKIIEDTICVIRSYGINIDKEELLKALKYDREQYDKGYGDGYTKGYNEGYMNGARDFKEKIKEQNAAYDEEFGCDMIYMSTQQLDDFFKYFVEEKN